MDEQEVSSVDNSPFDITRTGSVVYSAGNLPRHRVAMRATLEEIQPYRPKGSCVPLEPIKFATKNEGQMLNLTAHDPQEWTHIIDVWKNTTVADYINNFNNQDPNEMYKYLETFLGESVKALWESYKKNM
jgi:hypothetical protein